MLEEILRNINSNLERIANSLDSNKTIDIDLELESFKNQNVGQTNSNSTENSAQLQQSIPAVQSTAIPQVQQAIPMVMPQNPMLNSIAPQGMQYTPQSVQQPVAQPVQTNVIPTTVSQETFTQEQLAVAMANAVSIGKGNVSHSILQQLGVHTLSEVNPSDYNKVAIMLKEAGVEV